MGELVDFPSRHVEEGVGKEVSKLEFWKSRNLIIERDFHTFSVHQKQETLETVLRINEQLYELCLTLKGEL